MTYKEQISKLVEDNSWNGYFKRPGSGHLEYPLQIGNKTARADYCYEFGKRGKLFIEDDDDARALSNLIKYWKWCEENPTSYPVYLIHIIGRNKSLHINHCDFLRKHMEKALAPDNQFKYFLITHNNEWGNPQIWIQKLRTFLKEITIIHQLDLFVNNSEGNI